MNQQIVLNQAFTIQTFFILKGHGSQLHEMEYLFLIWKACNLVRTHQNPDFT
jgi:hypothetical protein